MKNTTIVKIGGATLGKHDTTIEDIVELQKRGESLVIVHGGGKLITDWLVKQQVTTRFVEGERVTDEATLEVVIAVLAGLVNKELAGAINSAGGKAAGISGVDGSLIQAQVKKAELGYVGLIVKIYAALLETLLESGFVPVVAPLGLGLSDKPCITPQLLNINADNVAGEIATAVEAEKLIFLTDIAGVCDNSGKVLAQLAPNEVEQLLTAGKIAGGMIPKVNACLGALRHMQTACIIDGREPHALLNEMEGKSTGTTIRASR